ncbi:MAG: hypothetical protein V1911_01490 [Candidatus Micrarchaeota archaeon]
MALVLSTKSLAQCVGLWLAEGDKKSIAEITFTNNCYPLIRFFHETLNAHFLSREAKPRIYVYSKGEKPSVNLSVAVNYYIDKRARTPYYIYKVASRSLVKKWYILVENVKLNEKLYTFVLQGFFAGEGNIKKQIKNNMHRSVRISQGKPNKFLEKMLNYFGITFSFEIGNRMYNITGRKNLEIVKKIGMCELHPLKYKSFEDLINSYRAKIIYNPKNWLKQQVYGCLIECFTTKQLSKKFGRSFARLQDVLIELKKDELVTNYRIGSLDYWIRNDQNIIIISKKKAHILRKLNQPKTIAQINNARKTRWQSTKNRLVELMKLKLVNKKGGLWYKCLIRKKIKVI